MTPSDTLVTTAVDPVVTIDPVTTQNTSSALTTGALDGRSQTGEIVYEGSTVDSSVAPVSITVAPQLSKGSSSQKASVAAGGAWPLVGLICVVAGLGAVGYYLYARKSRRYGYDYY